MERVDRETLFREIEGSRSEIARTVSELIRYPSENPPVENHDIQGYVREFLERSGHSCVLHLPGSNAAALTSAYAGRRKGPTLILYGHADVVPAGDVNGWKHPPYAGTVAGDRIYGRGASDMKSGLAAAMHAYRLLAERDIPIGGSVEFVSVLDEENWHRTPIGWNTSEWLIKEGKIRGEACVMGEPTSTSGIAVGERGDYWVRLRCRGEPGHGSTPVYEENACVRLFEAIRELHEMADGLIARPSADASTVMRSSTVSIPGVSAAPSKEKRGVTGSYSMNVGVVSGGAMINSVPEWCEARIAFCVPLGGSRKELDSEARKVLGKERYRGISLELLGESQSDPTFTPPSSRVAEGLSKAVREVTRRRPSFFVFPGTSDANVFRRNGIETCHYGPGTFRGIHGYNESVSLRDTVTVTKVYLQTILDYLA